MDDDRLSRISAERLVRIDPLAADGAAPEDAAPEDAERLAVHGAIGWSLEERVQPASVAAPRGKLHQFSLYPRWAGDPAALDALVTEWVTGILESDPGPESQALVRWPSRDAAAARVLRAHGLVPAMTTAICVHRGTQIEAAAQQRSWRIRRVMPGDLGGVAELWHDQLDYSAGVNTTTVRPYARSAGTQLLADAITSSSWMWVAEEEQQPIGLLQAWPPGGTQPRPPTTVRPAHWLPILAVTAEHWGRDVGAALVQIAHREFVGAGMAATLLAYTAFDPLSVPFWSRHGYRPLWSQWSAWPADTLR